MAWQHDLSPLLIDLGEVTIPFINVTFPFRIAWYGVMYVIGFIIGGYLVNRRAKRGLLKVNLEQASNFIPYMMVGMIVGARLFYVFLYDWPTYKARILSGDLLAPCAIWMGGLSFHGAAVGMAIASLLYARRYKRPFQEVHDTLVFSATLGIFFGRLGNFINGELYGRSTNVPWAVQFPNREGGFTDPKHPSQLYEAFGEGLLLWIVLLFVQKYCLNKQSYKSGYLSVVFLFGYGLVRFIVEFFREPDSQLGFIFMNLSMGQILCLLMMLSAALYAFFFVKGREVFVPEVPNEKFLKATEA